MTKSVVLRGHKGVELFLVREEAVAPGVGIQRIVIVIGLARRQGSLEACESRVADRCRRETGAPAGVVAWTEDVMRIGDLFFFSFSISSVGAPSCSG